jgi:hypothetical protein
VTDREAVDEKGHQRHYADADDQLACGIAVDARQRRQQHYRFGAGLRCESQLLLQTESDTARPASPRRNRCLDP